MYLNLYTLFFTVVYNILCTSGFTVPESDHQIRIINNEQISFQWCASAVLSVTDEKLSSGYIVCVSPSLMITFSSGRTSSIVS